MRKQVFDVLRSVTPPLLWALLAAVSLSIWLDSLAAGFCLFWTLAVLRGKS